MTNKIRQIFLSHSHKKSYMLCNFKISYNFSRTTQKLTIIFEGNDKFLSKFDESNQNTMNFALISLFLTLLFVYLIKTYLSFRKKIAKLPPILPGSFFSGNLKDLTAKNIHLKLTRIGHSYGDLFSLRVFDQYFVVLNSYETVSRILCSKTLESASRPDPFLIRLATNGLKDLVFSKPSTRWLQTRTLFHKFFTDMKKLHDRVDFSEIAFLEEWPGLFSKFGIESEKTTPLDLKFLISHVQSRILCTILFGQDVSNNESLMRKIVELNGKSKKLISNLYKIKLNMNPFEVLFGSGDFTLLYQNLKLQKVIMSEIFEFKSSNRNSTETVNSNGSRSICMKSLFDLFSNMSDIDESVMDCVYMKNVLTELIFAGMDTIVNSLNTFFFYMCLFPSVQKRAFEELNEINSGEPVSLTNRKCLPYVQACIYEAQRIATQLPLGIFRKTLSDIECLNYTIPEGTVLIPNIWEVTHDERVYPEPYKFRPERFLADSRGLVDFCDDKFKYLLSFGCGKRACPGKNAAQNLAFLFIVNILRNFEIKFDLKKCSNFDQDPRLFELASNLEPPEFKVRVSRREASWKSSLSLNAGLGNFINSSSSSIRRRSEIKTLCTDRLSLIESIREANLNDESEEEIIL
jgi:cytochrome P450